MGYGEVDGGALGLSGIGMYINQSFTSVVGVLCVISPRRLYIILEKQFFPEKEFLYL